MSLSDSDTVSDRGDHEKAYPRKNTPSEEITLSDEAIAIIVSRLQGELYSWTATTFILYASASFLGNPSLIQNISQNKVRYVYVLVVLLLFVIILFLIVALIDYYRRRRSLVERDITVPLRLDALAIGLVVFLVVVIMTIYIISLPRDDI